jgi:hypothetical protein
MNFGRSGATQTEERLILERDVAEFEPEDGARNWRRKLVRSRLLFDKVV